MKIFLKVTLFGVLSALLAACGGGGSGSESAEFKQLPSNMSVGVGQ